MDNKGTGFTLIELLVTISIISVLSVVGLVVYQGVTTKARDSIRKNDLNKLATALEIYYQKNNRYVAIVNPDNSITDITSCQTDPSTDASSPNTFYKTIKNNMGDGTVPADPSRNEAYCYLSSNNGQYFTLCAKLENPETNNPAPAACTTAGYNYVLVPK